MNVHLEPVASILRVFEDGESYGDAYAWCCTVRHLNATTVELAGVNKTPTAAIWRAVERWCIECGIITVVVFRIRDGKVVRKEWTPRKR